MGLIHLAQLASSSGSNTLHLAPVMPWPRSPASGQEKRLQFTRSHPVMLLMREQKEINK